MKASKDLTNRSLKADNNKKRAETKKTSLKKDGETEGGELMKGSTDRGQGGGRESDQRVYKQVSGGRQTREQRSDTGL